MMKKVMVVFGTRPEAIKMAPVIHRFKMCNTIDVKVCVTAQHRDMLDQVLSIFNIQPDFDLDLMKGKQSLAELTSRILIKFSSVLKDAKPDIVLVHGDTATTFGVSLACYYEKVDVGHVEAGLRTGDIYSPWPEEANRKLTAVLSHYHFAPTEASRANLLKEGVSSNNIFVTGNTVIDALLYISNRLSSDTNLTADIASQFEFLDSKKRTILVTSHRRENFGFGLENICRAITHITNVRKDIQILFPVHPNPAVHNTIYKHLSGNAQVYLVEPLDYLSFVYVMMKSYIIMSDSGGIQEEAPSLGKPVLVLRDNTERPEALLAGTIKLVGTDTKTIVGAIINLLDDHAEYSKVAKTTNPFGSGQAAEKIFNVIQKQ